MKLNELERRVLRWYLTHEHPARSLDGLDDIEVTERDFTGHGFFTSVAPAEVLHVGGDDPRVIWGEVGAQLNHDRQETGPRQKVRMPPCAPRCSSRSWSSPRGPT